MTAHAELVDALRGIAAPVCLQAGVELVEVHLSGSSRNRLVRVDVDRAGPRGVDLDDCQRVSEALGAALEASELIGDRYRLEVSSPGIDRPIRSADDIRRNMGRRVVVSTTEPLDGRRSFRGRLVGAADGALLVEEESREGATRAAKPLRIPLGKIEKAFQDAPF